MDLLLRDLRHAGRGLRRSGSVAILIILTLSLGIGAVTALFAVVDAVLLRPIVPAQERVVVASKLDTRRAAFPVPLSFPEFTAWSGESRSFEATAAVDHAATGVTTVTSEGRVSPVRVAPVSADFFRVVYSGQPLYGRWLRADDERRGAELVAVVSERFWRRATGGDSAFVGRRLSLAGDRSVVIIGIAPAAVDYPLGTDLWAPAAAVFDGGAGRFDASSRTFAQFEFIGRMRQGLLLTGVGVIVGLTGAFGLNRLLASLLFGVKPTDGTTMTGVIVAITLVAIAACLLPAWRASKLDPNAVLRAE